MDVNKTHQYGYHNIIMYLDRGLQAHALADVLAIVRSCACYVEEMPFPIVVNTVLLRLAETFQGEKFNSKLEFLNIVRLNIVKSVREFRNHLHVAFSSDEIVRCVMKVSHSNDFHARSLTLLFLAALAPLVSDNKKAHHLLMESLDCGEESELSAAIQAVTEFGRHSSFCALVVEKIGKVLCSNQTSFEVKLQLLNVVANFKESFAVAHACFQLSTRLLQCTFNRFLHVAIFNASTTLAARSCLVVGEQIALLLSELERAISNNNNTLTLCLLRNLARLADFPQHWQSTQISALRDMFERIREMRSRKGICAWLNCMEVLTSTGVHCDSVVEKDFSWITLLKSEDMILRISGIRLLINVMQNGSSEEHLRGIFLIVVAETIADISRISAQCKVDGSGELSEFRNAKKMFYRSISAFSRMPQCTSQNALCIVHELTCHSTLNSLVLVPNESRDERVTKSTLKTAQESLNMVVETLCSICDAHPAHCAPFAAKWALNQFVDFVEHTAISDANDEENDNDNRRVKRQRLETMSKLVGQIPFPLYNLILAPNRSIASRTVETGSSAEGMVMEVDGAALTEANVFERFLTAFDRMTEHSPNISTAAIELPLGFGAKSGAAVCHGWTRYKIARSAFHYGHWRRVALPLLKKLRSSCESLETSSWINALVNIAKSQIDDSEPFSVNKLNETYKYLRNAFLIFQRLAATPRRGEHCFAFAAAYVNCLAMSWQAIRLVLSALNVKLLALSQFLPQQGSEEKISKFCIEQLCDSLLSVRGNVTAAHAEWTSLFHRSFDADAQTLGHIHLWIQFMLVIENILLFSCAQPMRSILLTNNDFGGNAKASATIVAGTKIGGGIRGAANHHFHALLVSLKAVLDALLLNSEKGRSASELITRLQNVTDDANDAKLLREDVLQKRLSLENLRTIKEMLLSLKEFPLSLPRFFFQRTFRTQIKLNISPAPRETDSNTVSITTPLLPLTIEGVIQSDNAKRIESVTVIAEVQCLLNATKSFVDKRLIELDDEESYFKTQFLLKITGPVTKIHVRLLFTDSATKRSWVDESVVAELTVQYHEGVPSKS